MSRRFTAFVRWADAQGEAFNIEEIDVDADTYNEAKQLAQVELDRDYEPNGCIFFVQERIGWYM